jgi:multidrug resistance efflux pump
MAAKSEAQRDPVRRWTLIILGAIVALYLYSIIADRMTPYTSQATVQAFVVRMAPEVSGRVQEVLVSDNQKVKAGDILFRIDPQTYEIALKQADARLANVGQTIGANTAAVAASQERLIEAQAKRGHVVEQSNRTLELVKKGVYSEARKDLILKEIDVAEASVREAESELERARQELGPQGNDNPQFREALAAVERAKLDLVRTTVIAPADGVITNLQLADGQYVGVGQASLTLIDTADVWVNANFRENALENVKAGNPVELVLDTLPGRIYDAKVESIGWGVSQGSIDPETGLPKINEPMGLVRTPQRFAVKIEPNRQDYAAGRVRYGSQANVIVYASDNALVNAIGRLWMRIVAVLTYVS